MWGFFQASPQSLGTRGGWKRGSCQPQAVLLGIQPCGLRDHYPIPGPPAQSSAGLWGCFFHILLRPFLPDTPRPPGLLVTLQSAATLLGA